VSALANPFHKSKRGASEDARRKCLAYWGLSNPFGRLVMICQGKACGIFIDPVKDRHWEADHRITLAEGGKDEPPNIRPLCVACHKIKTNQEDKPRIAKGKSMRDKHFGIRRPAGWRK